MSTQTRMLQPMKILVVSMTTWGEMGNWLSGKSLGGTLAACVPGGAVAVEPAEGLIPRFQGVGERIKAVTLGSATPQERFERYAEVLRSLEPLFPAGFERNPEQYPELAAELQPLVERLKSEQPDLVIGTKGIICRCLIAALKLAGMERPVVNYVTNHGHFQFAAHRCDDAALHIVRFPEGKAYLEETCGWSSDSIRVVGYLIAAQQLMRQNMALPERDGSAGEGKRSVIIVSNRGGQEYGDLLEELTGYGDSIEVTFIAIRDEALCARAEAIVAKAGITSWRVVSELSQKELFQLMVRANLEGSCILVCKASPNSIFEAAYFNIPMFMVRTGLPMEEWGADIVVRERIGWVEETMAALAPQLKACLDDPKQLEATHARQREFSATYLDQERTVNNLLEALAAAQLRSAERG